MYPANNQSVAVPMLPANYYPDQPATVVQHTTVNVTRERVRDHIIYSLCSFVHMGNPLCLGLLAVIYSIKARDRKVMGDLEGAKKHATIALCLNIAVSVIFGLFVLSVIIAFSVILSQSPYYDYGPRYNHWN
ncbi:dispanin subfamily A member 2b-like [Corythoichthys intestinalis]|uniref:dispanin subfamily A member 2b-like n=1 Tax=Corythoichthys intestinalis TaxID=161448 RepID=UPI0025A6006B|nr:dispanin subfamily A member 2b-like [Corythoichthys intestinalis]